MSDQVGCEHGAMLHNEVVLRFCLSDQDSHHTVSHNYQGIGVGVHGIALPCLCPAHAAPRLVAVSMAHLVE